MRSSSDRVTGWGEMGWAAEGNILSMEGEGPATAWRSPGTASGHAREQGVQLRLDHKGFSSQEAASQP